MKHIKEIQQEVAKAWIALSQSPLQEAMLDAIVYGSGYLKVDKFGNTTRINLEDLCQELLMIKESKHGRS